MGVDWDLHLLSPLHGVFGDEHEYRPRNGTPFTINGILTVAMRRLQKTLMVIQKLTPPARCWGYVMLNFVSWVNRNLPYLTVCISKRSEVRSSISYLLCPTSNPTAMAARVLFSMWRKPDECFRNTTHGRGRAER